MALEDKAKRYFSSISTIANKMCADQDQIRSSYKDLWNTLTFREKEKILSTSIIKPELFSKYHMDCELKLDVNINYGSKIIIDDNYSYRDEYSAPFSLRTGSQRELDVFGINTKQSTKGVGICITDPKDYVPHTSKYLDIPNEILKKNPSTIHGSTESLSHFLPKTGLDFLDNW